MWDHKNLLVAKLLDIYSMQYLSKVCINSLSYYFYYMRDLFTVCNDSLPHQTTTCETSLRSRSLSLLHFIQLILKSHVFQPKNIEIHFEWITFLYSILQTDLLTNVCINNNRNIGEIQYFLSLFKGDFPEPLILYRCFFLPVHRTVFGKIFAMNENCLTDSLFMFT